MTHWSVDFDSCSMRHVRLGIICHIRKWLSLVVLYARYYHHEPANAGDQANTMP